MENSFLDYYKCPVPYAALFRRREAPAAKGFFSLGPEVALYGLYSGKLAAEHPSALLDDATKDIFTSNGVVELPFDPDEVVGNLHRELYVDHWRAGAMSLVANAYYLIRPLFPVSLRRQLQKFHLRNWQRLPFPRWPVDCSVDDAFRTLMLMVLRASGAERVPFIWFWPNGKRGCAVMTHDVESPKGRDFCRTLMDIDDSRQIKASFQVVPEERYSVSEEFLTCIRERGFEIAVHDLNHDGHLYRNRTEFLRRAAKINRYLKEYRTEGFRAGVLYRKQVWFDALQCSYEMSVPNVGHLDPQRGGCCTVMPYFIGDVLEIPVTTVQDYTLFHILNDYSLDLWKQQTELILQRNGLMSFIVHPDYVMKSRERRIFESLLDHIVELRDTREVWTSTPAQVNTWWRQRSNMELVERNGKWQIEGEGSDRARLAYAMEVDGQVVFTLAGIDGECDEPVGSDLGAYGSASTLV